MPEIFRAYGVVFLIYFNDHGDPHCHVRKAGSEALLRLDSVDVYKNFGFSPREIRRITQIAQERQGELLSAWYEIHGE